MGNFQATYGQTARRQWLAAAEENNVATLVSLMCGYFLLGQELRPMTDTDTQVPWHTG